MSERRLKTIQEGEYCGWLEKDCVCLVSGRLRGGSWHVVLSEARLKCYLRFLYRFAFEFVQRLLQHEIVMGAELYLRSIAVLLALFRCLFVVLLFDQMQLHQTRFFACFQFFLFVRILDVR